MTPESHAADIVDRDYLDKLRQEKQKALASVLQSRAFSRSDQLQAFLRYICETEIAGRGKDITEYSIATEALHRPAEYAPGEDSSVRSRAHALRRKLDEYYETEGQSDEVRIELPKGAYRPKFVPGVPPAAPAEKLLPAEIQVPAPPLRTGVHPLWLVAAIVVAALLTLTISRRFPPNPLDPMIRDAWGPVLQPGSDVLVLLSAPPLLRPVPSQPGVKPQPQASALEQAPEWAEQWFHGLNFETRGGPLYLARSRGYVVSSDAIAAMSVSSLIAASGASFHAAPETLVQPMAIHENGLVILGAPAYTSYLARVQKAMPYSFWFDPELNEEVLGQKADKNAPVYRVKRNPQTLRYSTVYGLITVLPSQPGRPKPERTLLFSGFTGSPGPQAAINFFRSPSALRDLLTRFQAEGHKQFPAAYQVVVRCGVDAENAINSIYETHKVISSAPVIE